MGQIAKAVDEEVVSRDLVSSFVKLLKDSEAEVRTAIAGQIPGKRRFPGYGIYLLMTIKVSVRSWIEIRCLMRLCRVLKIWCPIHLSMFVQLLVLN